MQTNILVELESLVHFARKAVDEEAALAVLPTLTLAVLCEGGGHGILEELDGDFHGDDEALTDVSTDHLAILGAFAVLFSAKEVSGYWKKRKRR